MIRIDHSDVIDWLGALPDESATACFCDPPYGLSFMGKAWDHGIPSVDVWHEAWRVLKPGGLLLAFGGTRTWHRLAVNIEDAGFEMHDTVMWLYGSGFPKSHNIGKAIDREAGAEREVVGFGLHAAYRQSQPYGQGARQDGSIDTRSVTAPATPDASTWDGYGTALKPAFEPCLLFRKPRRGTYAQTAVEHGTGALWVDGARVGIEAHVNRTSAAPGGNGQRLHGGDGRNVENARLYSEQSKAKSPSVVYGRWPANVALVHDEGCGAECTDTCAVRVLGEQSGDVRSSGVFNRGQFHGDKQGAASIPINGDTGAMYSDIGTAARFFYHAKASRSEREAGLDGLDVVRIAANNHGNATDDSDDLSARWQTTVRNHHPTVKPLTVCEYMARLILPPVAYRSDAVLLVPYAGSGSEMIGAWQAGWHNIIGCELEQEYIEIAQRRIAHWCNQGVLL